jgi:hypothetical protein
MNGTPDNKESWDPDGGPVISRGDDITIDSTAYKVVELRNISETSDGACELTCKVALPR